jgi:hypothetical protein
MTSPRPIAPGVAWGAPCADAPDVVVHGDDVALARAVSEARAEGIVPLIAWRPDADSDLARAVGANTGSSGSHHALPLDAIELRSAELGAPVVAVNVVIVGVAPDRARPWTRGAVRADGTTGWGAVVATGQFSGGLDLVPRGHPGDGRLELQVYAVPGAQRSELRRRLRTGTHVPHPQIRQRAVTEVVVDTTRAVSLTVDGQTLGRVRTVVCTVLPSAYRLLV